jgi:hypothetical protein
VMSGAEACDQDDCEYECDCGDGVGKRNAENHGIPRFVQGCHRVSKRKPNAAPTEATLRFGC